MGEGHCSGADRRWRECGGRRGDGAGHCERDARGSWVVLLRMSAVAAVLNAAAYLKKSPLPVDEKEEKGEVHE